MPGQMVAFFAHRMAWGMLPVIERGYPPLRIGSALDAHGHRRTERLPAMLVVTPPRDTTRLAHDVRNDRRSSRSTTAAEPTVRSGRFPPDQLHPLEREPQHLRDIAAIALRPLRARPYDRAVRVDVGDCAGRPNHGVVLEWKVIGRLEMSLALRQPRGNVALIVTKLVAHHRELGQLSINAAEIGQSLGRAPFSLKRERSPDGILFAGSDHAQKIVAPDDLRAGNAANRVAVH